MEETKNQITSALVPDGRAPNLLIGADVEIDPTAQIGANVVLYDGVKIGPHALVKHNCVIGERPTLAIDSRAPLQVLDETIIAAGATICNGVVMFAGASIGQDTIIGDQVYVREGASVAEDCVIGRGALVAAGATVGARTKVQAQSMILPRMVVEEDVSIGGMVSGATDHSSGRDPSRAQQQVILRRGCRIGSAACLLPGIEIGEEAVVAAGAVVLKSVEARTKVAGVPARVIGVVADDELI